MIYTDLTKQALQLSFAAYKDQLEKELCFTLNTLAKATETTF